MECQAYLRMLGPVQVRVAQSWQTPRGAQLRLLMAFLALSAGQVVSADDLVDLLWDERPPRSARASLQILVTRLRKSLAGVPDCTARRYGEGYCLQVDRGLADVHVFRSLISRARERPDSHAAIAIFDQALLLWRGPALADVPDTVRVRAIRSGLTEEHLSAIESRFSCLLAADRDAEAAEEIPLVLASYPLAERLAGLLMIARYRVGRQADALKVFRDLRDRLAGELGVEPGPELQRLHQRVLAGDQALAAPDRLSWLPLRTGGAGVLARGHEPAGGSGPANGQGQANGYSPAIAHRPAGVHGPADGPGPADAPAADNDVPHARRWQPASHAGQPGSRNGHGQAVPPQGLPAAPAHFVGRHRELSMLARWLNGGEAPAEPVTLAITGMAGVGKTALALHWAHQVRSRFPDGQLYVNLRGFDPSPAAMMPGEAISGLLEVLGVSPSRVSARLDAQSGLYRSLLAGRRMLIVLDNARDEAQVRPLLPGSSGCAVIVTSRNQLAGLVAAEGAHPLRLDVLAGPEARQLLASRLGADRVAAEAEEVTELTALCARLPLALAIIAARAALRPSFPLALLATGLRDLRRRLDGLDAGEQAADVRAVLSWSYRLLSEPAARLLRLLAAHPGPDISAAAVASLAAAPEPLARDALSELTRASLILEHSPDRFALHDLVRAYAAGLCGEAETGSAMGRVLDHYLHTARAAVRLAYPHAHRVRALAPGCEPPEHLGAADQALAWLQAEYPVLVAAAAVAASSGFDAHACQVSAALSEYHARRGYYRDWERCQRQALAAAVRLGDQNAQAVARQLLGEALIQLGSLQEARDCLREGLRLFRDLGDPAGQADCHCSMARICELGKDHSQALYHAQLALTLYRAAGYLAGQAAALNAIGWYYAQLSDGPRAVSYCERALDLHRKTGNRFEEAVTLDSLGYCCHQSGQHGQAAQYYQQALRAYADSGDRFYRAQTLIHLGDTHRAGGQPRAGRDAWQQALAILDDLHHPDAHSVRARLDGEADDPGSPAVVVST